MQDFNNKVISAQDELIEIVATLSQKYKGLEYAKYETIEADLLDSLQRLKIAAVIPIDIQPWLMSNPDLLEYFFQVMPVVKYEKKTYSQIVSSFLTPYLDDLAIRMRNWHLPPELQDLIDWEVRPVEIDRYFELARARKFTDPLAKQANQSTISEEIKLSQVRDTAYLVITGGAGAGKSTCLRYLCHRLSIEARDMIATGQIDVQIPVILSLRNYGPYKLRGNALSTIAIIQSFNYASGFRSHPREHGHHSVT